jgi:hypothetical protein
MGGLKGPRADVPLTAALTTATRATTSCISNWVPSVRSRRTSRARFRPEDSSVYHRQNRNDW